MCSWSVLRFLLVMARDSTHGVLGLEDRVGNQPARVLVLEPVKHACTLLAAGHEACQSQFGEMLRNGCRRFVDDVRQVIHGHLAILEGENQADPGRIGEHREDLNSEFNKLAVWIKTTNFPICMHTQIIAYWIPVNTTIQTKGPAIG